MVKEGTIIRLEYFDQNVFFEKNFPAQNCEITKRFLSEYDDWFLIKLSQTFFTVKLKISTY